MNLHCLFRNLAVLVATAEYLAFLPGPAGTKEISIGVSAPAKFEAPKVLSNPKPEIPQELSEAGLKSVCLAEFTIAADGKVSVKLLTSSGSEELDDLTLSALRRWKFRPAVLDGEPVSASKRVKVEFEVN